MTEPAYRCVDCFAPIPERHKRCIDCATKQAEGPNGSLKANASHPLGRSKTNR